MRVCDSVIWMEYVFKRRSERGSLLSHPVKIGRSEEPPIAVGLSRDLHLGSGRGTWGIIWRTIHYNIRISNVCFLSAMAVLMNHLRIILPKCDYHMLNVITEASAAHIPANWAWSSTALWFVNWAKIIQSTRNRKGLWPRYIWAPVTFMRKCGGSLLETRSAGVYSRTSTLPLPPTIATITVEREPKWDHLNNSILTA